jgi:hypothetical protein
VNSKDRFRLSREVKKLFSFVLCDDICVSIDVKIELLHQALMITYSIQLNSSPPEGVYLTFPKRLNMDEIFAASHIIWTDTRTADKIAIEANRLVNIAHCRKFSFFSGKSSKCVVGGLFYLLGYRFDAVKNQRQLADKLGTTDVSIRASYRQWMETFPDLFTDVIGKFVQIKDLRTYVLLSLKKTLANESRIGKKSCRTVDLLNRV